MEWEPKLCGACKCLVISKKSCILRVYTIVPPILSINRRGSLGLATIVVESTPVSYSKYERVCDRSMCQCIRVRGQRGVV
eukprot:scaffold9954_cov152-Amphora_coffeaeformis.AAC.1